MADRRAESTTRFSLVLAIGYSLAAGTVQGWEVHTHAAITGSAVARSLLADPATHARLGLPAGDNLGSSYFDFTIGAIKRREASGMYENRILAAEPFGVDPVSPAGWIMRGAIREDDNPRDKGRYSDDEDPYGEVYRVLHHFFDPAYDRGLTLLGIPVGLRSPDWAIGTADAFAIQVQAQLTRRNHFSAFDAREAMWRALTERQKDGTVLAPPPGMSRSEMRKAYWASMFRSLGDILHLNQDMSQPQHTRNERHAGETFGDGSSFLGNRSVIEAYVDLRYNNGVLTLPANQAVAAPALNLVDYPIPAFTRYSDFWSTSVGSAAQGNLASGRGLADFSNREFFSAAKNLLSAANDYGSPPGQLSAYTTEVVTNPLNWAAQPVGSTMTLYKRAIADAQAATAVVAPATAESAWDQFFRPTGGRKFTLNHYVYRAQAEALLPRAIAYSAGLLDYFLRGRLEVTLPDEGVYGIVDIAAGGFPTVKFKIRNATAGAGETMQSGALHAVARFHRNTCFASSLSGEYGTPGQNWSACRDPNSEIVVSEACSVPDGLSRDRANPATCSFVDRIPLGATDLFLHVIYRGPLGSEQDAIAVTTLDLAEPTFAGIYNVQDQGLYGPEPASLTFAQWCAASSVPLEQCKDDHAGTIVFSFNDPGGPWLLPGSPPLPPFKAENLPVSRVARFALLTDQPATWIYVQNTHYAELTSHLIPSARNQVDAAGNLAPTAYSLFRGIYVPDDEYRYLTSWPVVPTDPITHWPVTIRF